MISATLKSPHTHVYSSICCAIEEDPHIDKQLEKSIFYDDFIFVALSKRGIFQPLKFSVSEIHLLWNKLDDSIFENIFVQTIKGIGMHIVKPLDGTLFVAKYSRKTKTPAKEIKKEFWKAKRIIRLLTG